MRQNGCWWDDKDDGRVETDFIDFYSDLPSLEKVEHDSFFRDIDDYKMCNGMKPKQPMPHLIIAMISDNIKVP